MFAEYAKKKYTELSIVENKNSDPRSTKYFRFKNGRCSISFAGANELLKLRVIGDKVYLDSNADGKIDTNDKAYTRQGILNIPIVMGKIKTQYPLCIQYINKKGVSLSSNFALKGKIDGKDIILLDSNLNGSFQPGKGNQVVINNKLVPFGKALYIGKDIYFIRLPQKTTVLEYSKYDGKMSQVSINAEKNWKIIADFVNTKNQLLVHGDSSSPFRIMPGKYKLHKLTAILYGQEKDEDDLFAAFDAEPPELMNINGYRLSRGTVYNFSKTDNTVKIGPPFKISFKLLQSDKRDWRKLKIQNLVLKGKGGENYRLTAEGENQKSTLASYIRSGKKEKQLSKMEYG